MMCPVCGEDVWVSKSNPVELWRNYYKRSMRCSNCADGKKLTVYRCYPISEKEMAEEYANLVPPLSSITILRPALMARVRKSNSEGKF